MQISDHVSPSERDDFEFVTRTANIVYVLVCMLFLFIYIFIGGRFSPSPLLACGFEGRRPVGLHRMWGLSVDTSNPSLYSRRSLHVV
jgi:hypothetical protein